MLVVVVSFTSGCVTRMNVEENNGPNGYRKIDKSWSTSPAFGGRSDNDSHWSSRLFRLQIGGGGYTTPATYSTVGTVYGGGYSYGGSYGTYSYIPSRGQELYNRNHTMRQYGVGGGHGGNAHQHGQPSQPGQYRYGR